MADEETPGDEGAGEKEAPKAEMVPKDRLDEAIARNRMYEDTIKALGSGGGGGREQPRGSMAGAVEDAVTQMATQLGRTPAEVREWQGFLAPFFQQMAQPYLQALNTLADRYDSLDIRTKVGKDEYEKISDEVEKEYLDRAKRGEWASRNDIYNMVRARKLPDIMAEERKKIETEVRQRLEAQQSGHQPPDAGIEQPVRRAKEPTLDELRQLPLDEKMKWLEDKTF